MTLFGAWGPCKQGWPQVSRTFRWVASRLGAQSSAESEETLVRVNGDMAYTVGYEAWGDGHRRERRPTTIRVTQVHRHEDSERKITRRHGDFAPIDQSAGKV